MGPLAVVLICARVLVQALILFIRVEDNRDQAAVESAAALVIAWLAIAAIGFRQLFSYLGSARHDYYGLFEHWILGYAGASLCASIAQIYFAYFVQSRWNVPMWGAGISVEVRLQQICMTIDASIAMLLLTMRRLPKNCPLSLDNTTAETEGLLDEDDCSMRLADRILTDAHNKFRPISAEFGNPILHNLWFAWVSGIVALGKVRQVQVDDLSEPPAEYSLSASWARFCNCNSSSIKNRQWSLAWMLMRTFKREILAQLVLNPLCVILSYMQPFIIQQLLHFIGMHANDSSTSSRFGYLLAGALLCSSIASTVVDEQQMWHARLLGIQMRNVIVVLLHQKTIQRPKGGSREKGNTDGKAYNVLTADLTRLNKFTSVVSGVALVPWQQAVGAWYMYRLLGLAGILGTVLLALSMQLTRRLVAKARRIEVELGKLNDQRLALISEMMRGISSVKLFGWGTRFMSIIGDKRQEQLMLLWRRAQIWSLISLCTLGSLPLVMFATFIAYSLGHTMTAETVFTAISVFKLVQTSIDWMPGLAAECLSFYVSFRRIEAYLDGQEVQPLYERLGGSDNGTELGFDNATLSWNSGRRTDELTDNESFRLCDLQVRFPDGGLTLIGGPTGSGKSSLLAALAGEMQLESGRVLVPASPKASDESIDMSSSAVLDDIAYVAQEPWLRNATIRDNILFGERYHRQRYERVLHMCALTADLAILEAGDMTEIGERGITLSGGQRQRVALARAIYSSRQKLLIDDCLSAVDAQTGRHILHSCLRSKDEIMRGRTCLLVTHHMAMCLQHSEYVVLMEGGRIIFQGTPDEARSSPLVSLSEVDEGSVQHKEVMEGGALAGAARESGRLVDEEERRRGAVGLETWQEYFRPCGGWKLVGACLTSAVAMQLLTMGKDYYLAEKVGGNSGSATQWLVVYLGLGTASAAGSALALLGAYSAGLRTSAALHGRLLEAMVCATPRFLNSTPVGRILVRFSSDMQVVDEDIIEILMRCVRSAVVVGATLAVVAWTVPAFAVVGVAVAGAYAWLMWQFVQAQREGRRLQAICVAPVVSLQTEMLSGGDTIRAFGMQAAFAHEAARRVSTFVRVDYVLRATRRWLGMRMGVASAVAAAATSAFVVAHAHRLGAGLGGFVLVYAGAFWAEAVAAVRQCSNLELSLGCVERLRQYLDVAREAPSVTGADNMLAAGWPATGRIEVQELVAGYTKAVPVLHGLSFAVVHGEKIGVVGRTGAGKSTLAQALLRLIEASSGAVVLDGVDVAAIGLERLRQSITIIPQDPVLFNGTVRFNLDPFGDHPDELLLDVLRRTLLLRDQSASHGGGVAAFTSLDDVITGSGQGLSLGQRQLVALARALVRRSRVVIMDEATASVDFDTDESMQRAIRGAELADSTLLCIAHRLRTIIDYDRILVLDKGKVVEFDTPRNLLQIADGHFRRLCESSNEFALLQSLAK
ncbi:hypothetical protein H4R20_001018 [Coemansia guatemalensis]|uniref:P-loop containing nucleoside triphosphate hydrolase protein n=1 Tax=Coemansia guatemalensis TaxID=2761395 RepID=A0A9W8I047_9FUNG|nr:hypothetical protein H4R20_001018 [Coemansia guatemalensis]